MNDSLLCAARQVAWVHGDGGHDPPVGAPQEKMTAALASFFESGFLQGGDQLSRSEGWKPAHATAGDLT